MSKPTTHVLLLVDDSGSMLGVADDVRDGFNSYIQSLIDDKDGTYRVTVGLFGSQYDTLAVAEKPKKVERLDSLNYSARQWSTSLYDAIGRIIQDFEQANPNLPKDDRVLLVIQTDGQDNSSKEFSLATVREMLQARQSGEVWRVLFLGAGMDAWQAGSSLGLGKNSVYQTSQTAQGYSAAYDGVTRSSVATSRGGSRAEVEEAMREALKADR